jgi:ribosomal protein L11 methyltransferase
MTVTVARLACDEPTARRLASHLAERLEAQDCVCSAFEGDDGRWQVAVHFVAAPDEPALRALFADAGADASALMLSPLAETDWVAQSLAGLKPVRAGRFLVHGAHDRARVPANCIAIEIEAALAFGTGHHGSTRGCLLALDALAKRKNPRRVLDIGTGSGVLAIAAAKTFRRRVVASDIDRTAVAAARANARLNCVAPLLAPLQAKGIDAGAIAARAPYDLIFANILLAPLLRLAVPIGRLAHGRAHVVLSGLLPRDANALLSVYRAQGLTLERRIALDRWVTLVLVRK